MENVHEKSKHIIYIIRVILLIFLKIEKNGMTEGMTLKLTINFTEVLCQHYN